MLPHPEMAALDGFVERGPRHSTNTATRFDEPAGSEHAGALTLVVPSLAASRLISSRLQGHTRLALTFGYSA